MGKFRFRLEKVREHRQRQVDSCSLVVAQLNQRLEQLEQLKTQLKIDIRRQAENMAGLRGGEVNGRDYLAGTAWLEHLHRQSESLDLMIARAMEELVQAREEMARAWMDLEVMGRLRQKQETDWRQDQIRNERWDMDEIGQWKGRAIQADKVAH